MNILEGDPFTEMNQRAALYAPLYAWCQLLVTPYDPDAPKIDMDAEFYRALDQVVRHDDFSVDEVAKLLAAYFCGDLDFPECAEYHHDLCWRAKVVREYVEARGEAKKQQKQARPELRFVT